MFAAYKYENINNNIYKSSTNSKYESTLIRLRALSDYTYIRTGSLRAKCGALHRRCFLGRILCYVVCLMLVTYVAANIRALTQDEATLLRQEQCRLKPEFRRNAVDDFAGFPCFPGLVPSTTLAARGKCVRIMDRSNFRIFISLDESCKYLRMGKRTPICSYNSVKNDTSDYYSNEGIGERRQVEDMIKVLKSNPEMRFIDIGTRTGVYCIAASKVNNQVLCLDANVRYLKQITRSLFLGGIINNALMIWNKLSDKQGTVNFRVPAVRDPILLDEPIGDSRKKHKEYDFNMKINTITLENLSGAFGGKPVFMKIDIGADLETVLEGSKQFFAQEDVRIVQIALTAKNNRYSVIDFFRHFQFLPFGDAFGAVPMLEFENINKWPRNIYFLKVKMVTG